MEGASHFIPELSHFIPELFHLSGTFAIFFPELSPGTVEEGGKCVLGPLDPGKCLVTKTCKCHIYSFFLLIYLWPPPLALGGEITFDQIETS